MKTQNPISAGSGCNTNRWPACNAMPVTVAMAQPTLPTRRRDSRLYALNATPRWPNIGGRGNGIRLRPRIVRTAMVPTARTTIPCSTTPSQIFAPSVMIRQILTSSMPISRSRRAPDHVLPVTIPMAARKRTCSIRKNTIRLRPVTVMIAMKGNPPALRSIVFPVMIVTRLRKK